MGVLIPPEILKVFAKARPADRTRVLAAIRQVADATPQRLPFVTELVGGDGIRRLRKGDWRVVHTIDGERPVVRAIDQRRDIHR